MFATEVKTSQKLGSASDFALVLLIVALDSPQFPPFSEDNMNSPKEPAKNAHTNEQLPNEPKDGSMADEGATLDASPSSLGEQTEAAQHRRVGPYRLSRKLGQGGMGQVWLAEQTAPLRRQVALKLIKAGLFDDALLERFQGERQSLALMNHPAIAKVFDAGATPEGQPYFAMEYVEGLPITDYCDQKRLKIAERLELFIKVCEGVQHAHQKAIIHRDLKPANILVVDVDGKPSPRIIDFGIAKALSSRTARDTLLTQFGGGFVGTPGYVSPEQADPAVEDVDTRTDVYSLGVILYVLLTGCLPFDSALWKQKAFPEILRQLRDEDPPRPSSKISSARDTQKTTAELRQAEPQQLASLLHGDLDWITMKAIEKDRDRRYATPSELAADLARFLQNRPVEARPATTAYRLRKYARRHRVAVGVVSGLAALLIAFAITQAIQLRRITRERDRADRVTTFMINMFKVSDPSEARGTSVTAREILDKASKEIDAGLGKDPQVQAQMMDVMGLVYQNLGLYPRAQTLVEKAIAIKSPLFGQENVETLKSMNMLVGVLEHEGRDKEAETLGRQTLDLAQRKFGAADRNTIKSMHDLASVLDDEGKFEEAEKLQRDSLKLAQAVFGPNDPDIVRFMSGLAAVEVHQNRIPEGEKLLREALEIQRRIVGPDHPDTLLLMNNLAATLDDGGHPEEAEKLERELLEVQLRILGPEHPDTLMTTSNLANYISDQGKYAEAEKLQRQTLEIQRRVLGPEHPETLRTMDNLANAISEQHRYSEAEQLERQTIELRRKVSGPEHPFTAMAVYDLACILALQGRRDEAFAQLRQSIEHGMPLKILAGIPSDSDLQSLHSDPRFNVIAAEATKRLAAATHKLQ